MKPAGENHASATLSVFAHKPAIAPEATIQRYTSLYLSYTYKAVESITAYEDEVRASAQVFTSAAAVALFTVSATAGETNATQSLRPSAIAIILFAIVTSSAAAVSGPINRFMSTVSASSNKSYAVSNSPTVGVLSDTPPVSDTVIAVEPVTNAAPAAVSVEV